MSETFIPVASPYAQYRRHREEIRGAIDRVLESGRYVLGEEVAGFEEEFAAFVGRKHCISVANGTEALSLALLACGVLPGDEVITVSHTAVATVAAIELIGAVPVFVDIDPLTRCMDHSLLEGAVSKKTKAVVPVHIYGQPAPMREVCETAMKHGLKVVEDCAQAIGSEISGKRAGTFGHAAAFSFYPTKNLGALGDGGAVVTGDPAIGQKVRALREYGWEERYISKTPGMNSRLDEVQAAILRVKLPFLNEDNDRRIRIAGQYAQALHGSSIKPPMIVPGTLHSMHLYVVECRERLALQEFLKERAIGTAFHYPEPVHRQDAYKERIRGWDRLTFTERLYGEILTLPMYPELTDRDVERVCTALSAWCSIR